ncbi:nucleoside deaminase [Thaumasiovibrio sp. DFM-14]|uniref:nucleoside deaminase n=1 Tax=Thaumasiovibrio sp. DFM-14 TaxID=3384792 RepID=UPI0039A1C735
MTNPIETLHSERMKDLIEYTSSSLKTKYPSPFGASIYDAEGTLIAQAYDTVMKEGDPTCHGEVNAVRKAVKKLGNHSLKGCTLYSTCEPCSMCMSTSIWAEIDTVVFGATVNEDASQYWDQPLDITAKEIADRMISNKCTVIPEVERRLAQQLFRDWKLAIGD